MEVLPHLWINYYNNNNHILIKDKKIKNIIHISKKESYIFQNKIEIEEIRIPFDYHENNNYEEQNNIVYEHLFDITEYINNKINNNCNILIIGHENKQDIEIIIISYLIRYGKLNIRDSILFFKSKKENIFEPKCLFYYALNRFYENCSKFN
jgi:hypothetical protein